MKPRRGEREAAQESRRTMSSCEAHQTGENIYGLPRCQGKPSQRDSLLPTFFVMLGPAQPPMTTVVTHKASRRTGLFTGMALLALGASPFAWPTAGAASSVDQLIDLTGHAGIVVTLIGRDNFTSEYRYQVSVKNISADHLVADSLVLVLDKITNLAGEDRDNLQGELFINRFEVLDQDGTTDDGKPYFRVPAGPKKDLSPHDQSPPTSVRIRNRDYLIVFTPSFRVFGQKRPPAEAKPATGPSQPQATSPASSAPSAAGSKAQVDKLIQLLIKKGIITEDEWRKAGGGANER